MTEKDVLIRNLNARQQDQAKALQESTSKVTRDQVMLRRLATKPGAASSIAEAEVAIASLKLSQVTAPEQTLQAQRLLDAATASYAKGNYGTTMDHAAQTREFIEMVKDNHSRKALDQRLAMVAFNIPIPLRAKSNVNLRRKPYGNAARLITLKKDSALTAKAYLGDWLQVQTSDMRSGWVLNTLVEVRVGDLDH
ncbi:MAG: SH3 domain-containing protein [Candidatus Nitrotoga sp.]